MGSSIYRTAPRAVLPTHSSLRSSFAEMEPPSPGAGPRWAGKAGKAPRAEHAKLCHRTRAILALALRAVLARGGPSLLLRAGQAAARRLAQSAAASLRRSFVQPLRKAPPTPSNRNGGGLFLLAAKEEMGEEFRHSFWIWCFVSVRGAWAAGVLPVHGGCVPAPP
jgi:hypothetical protein